MKEQIPVGIVMGSDSDWPRVQKTVDVLNDFGVRSEVRVISAHRTPDVASEYAATAEARGVRVLICAAGGAAHLGGVMAAHTCLPVIGIPVAGGAFNGLDSLLSTLQMPAGVPVATVAVGGAGPVNAALLAVQMLAIGDGALRERFREYKRTLRRKVEAGDARVQKALASQHREEA